MPRYVAFLRAVNVGGRTVKMSDARALFEAHGFTEVETFLASGNVVFTSSRPKAATMASSLEPALRDAFGFPIATFLRAEAEIARLVRSRPFPDRALAAAAALNVAFLATPPAAPAIRALQALQSPIDEFRVLGREVWWLCRHKQSGSAFSNAVLEKTLGQPSTIRGASTLQKLTARFGFQE